MKFCTILLITAASAYPASPISGQLVSAFKSKGAIPAKKSVKFSLPFTPSKHDMESIIKGIGNVVFEESDMHLPTALLQNKINTQDESNSIKNAVHSAAVLKEQLAAAKLKAPGTFETLSPPIVPAPFLWQASHDADFGVDDRLRELYRVTALESAKFFKPFRKSRTNAELDSLVDTQTRAIAHLHKILYHLRTPASEHGSLVKSTNGFEEEANRHIAQLKSTLTNNLLGSLRRNDPNQVAPRVVIKRFSKWLGIINDDVNAMKGFDLPFFKGVTYEDLAVLIKSMQKE